jgi:hypothetical protein
MKEEYTYHDGEWCYSNEKPKKIVIKCDTCKIKKELTEIEKYECKICEKLKEKIKF